MFFCLAEHSWTRVGCGAAQVRPGPVVARAASLRGPRRRFAHASATARKRKRRNRFRERMWFEPGPGTRTCKSASRADFPRGYGSPRCPLPPREPSWGALGTRWGLLGLLQGTGGTCGGSARKPAKGPLGLGEDESGARSEEEKPWGRGIRVEVLPQTLQKPAPAPRLQAALVLCGDAVE